MPLMGCEVHVLIQCKKYICDTWHTHYIREDTSTINIKEILKLLFVNISYETFCMLLYCMHLHLTIGNMGVSNSFIHEHFFNVRNRTNRKKYDQRSKNIIIHDKNIKFRHVSRVSSNIDCRKSNHKTHICDVIMI